MTLEISREDVCKTLVREYGKNEEYFSVRMRKGSLSDEYAERVLTVKKKVIFLI